MRKILPFLMCLLLAACSAPVLVDKRPASEVTAPVEETTVEKTPSEYQQARVAKALAMEAEHLDKAGRHDEAIVKLERALAIDGKNGRLWQRLAVVRFNQKDWKVAEALAKKSLVYSKSNPEVARVSWLIIAESRRFLGDNEGAAMAMKRSKRIP